MNEKWKYIGAIIGAVTGLIYASTTIYYFAELLPVPLAIIGYSIGALLENKS